MQTLVAVSIEENPQKRRSKENFQNNMALPWTTAMEGR